ncbi:T3SS secreted effector EspM [Escherichia coli]|nr:T3SS secreted effector EspM [Escherichia coli]
MPVNATGVSFSSFGISYHKDNSFRGTIRGKNDEVVKCSQWESALSALMLTNLAAVYWRR